MHLRVLGRGGIEVSALGMGCWAIGGPFWAGEQPLGWGRVDDDESVRAIHAALEAGITFFDTADVYGAGHSERVLARALGRRRDDVVIATKFGSTFDETTRQTGEPDASPAHAGRAVRESLRRLRTDHIDLYQLHLNDLPVPAALELIPALEDLVTAGMIRSYGWSTDFPERATAFAAAGPHAVAIQHEMNVLHDADQVLAVCDRFDLASINRGPLAMGLLTGKFTADSTLGRDDVRGVPPDWMVFFRDGRPAPELLDRIEALRAVLASGGRTLAQGAIAWLWARHPRTIPIPGFRTEAQVRQNAGALEYGPLAAGQMAEVARLLAG